MTTCSSWLTISTAAAELVAHRLDAAVEARRTRLVEPLGGLVEHEQVGRVEERAGEQHALELPAREFAHLPLAEGWARRHARAPRRRASRG